MIARLKAAWSRLVAWFRAADDDDDGGPVNFWNEW